MSIRTDDRTVEGRTSPSYLKVREWLLSYIREQKLEAGDRIPSERILAGLVGLSRPKVARAVSELVEEGVLVRENRSGTFVGGGRRPVTSTRTISVIKAGPSVPNEPVKVQPLFEDIVHGVTAFLSEHGYRVSLRYNSYIEEEAEILADLRNQQIEGAIVYPAIQGAGARTYAKYALDGPPIVLVDVYFPSVPLDRVVTDNLAGARDAVRHLIRKGHRRIAFFTEFGRVTSEMEREAGYRAALEEAGIPYDESIVCGPQILRHTRHSFDLALEHLMRIPDPITAVFGMNDNVVWATLQAASNQNISVPGDLEVAGFFDAPIPPGVQAHFTRVVQSKFEIGQAAARILLDRINGEAPSEPQHITVPPTLVE